MTNALASSPDFVVRAATDDDINYVRKTWLREYAEHAYPSLREMGISKDVYDREHKRCLEAALERGAVTIAYRPAVPSGICGFAVTEADTIHFVYVKPRWGRLGVAKLLMRPFLEKDACYTHRTVLLRGLPKQWTYNPYLFLRS